VMKVRNRQKGFILLEILVGLALLGIITVVFLNGLTTTFRGITVSQVTNGTVDITNVNYFHGAVGGKTVLLTNVDELLYAQELQGREDLPGGELATIAYSYE